MARRNGKLDSYMRGLGYVTPTEAAERTGISRSTVYGAITTGEIKSVVDRGFTFVQVKSVLAWAGDGGRAAWATWAKAMERAKAAAAEPTSES